MPLPDNDTSQDGRTLIRELKLADRFRQFTDARRRGYIGKPAEDEILWAQERLKEAMPLLEGIARSGGSRGYIDIPEADLVRSVSGENPLVRGGADALTQMLLEQRFAVSLYHRHAGHARGEYALEVSW